MNPYIIIGIIVLYFLVLIAISWFTSRNSSTQSFFDADKSNPWYVVAFGMIGTSLSGATFISVPGQVLTDGFSYFQMVLGYLLGYLFIANVLMPLFYKMNLISIYGYLEKRFGVYSYKTGAGFFLLSRTIGSAARFYIVVSVLQLAIFDALGVPLPLTAAIALALIWLYTFKGGVKTIVYTDTLQTVFMLSSLVISFILVAQAIELSPMELFQEVQDSRMSKIFVWDIAAPNYFFKQFIAGAFITIVMTGLDQDLMQKNLTCKNLGEAQKNMLWFSITLVVVNFLFLTLGAALYLFATKNGLSLPAKSDQVYPFLALHHFAPVAGIVFILGIIAASYASTDSALTALTTSFCIDIINIGKVPLEKDKQRIKTWVHLGLTALMLLVVILFAQFNNDALIKTIFKLAGYTYGPLLGLFAFGLYSGRDTKDNLVPYIAVLSPIISYLLNLYSKELLFGYTFGFEILIVNGLITYLGLFIFSRKQGIQKNMA